MILAAVRTRGCGKTRVKVWEGVIRRLLRMSRSVMMVTCKRVVTVALELRSGQSNEFPSCTHSYMWTGKKNAR